MNRHKNVVVCTFFILALGSLLWLIGSTWVQFKTFKNSVNTESQPYQGPEIHKAAAQGELEKIKLKLNQNSNLISSLDSQRNTPLHVAAFYGNAEIVKFLIANGAEVNSRGKGGFTPLVSTLFFGFRQKRTDSDSVKDVVEILIDSGADVNTKTLSGSTPLHYVAACATKEVVELLISAGADINATNDDGDTPLNTACRYRRKKKGGVIDLLHKHGAVRRHGKNNSYDYEPDLIFLRNSTGFNP